MIDQIEPPHRVGTGFIPSSDSSPCTISTRLLPGFILMHGDESLDAVMVFD